MQLSQLVPLYPFHLVGNSEATISGAWLRSGPWSGQGQPSPCSFPVMMLPNDWFPVEIDDHDVDLASYIEAAAGSVADLDQTLEAAAIEYLLRDDQAEPQ